MGLKKKKEIMYGRYSFPSRFTSCKRYELHLVLTGKIQEKLHKKGKRKGMKKGLQQRQ